LAIHCAFSMNAHERHEIGEAVFIRRGSPLVANNRLD
jgi:hypothetical protein